MSPVANRNHVTYRSDIDGLRAIAVLAVLFFHAGLGFPGGFVGVDIFFVVSGYLITGLILKDLDRDRFHVRDFWERRVRRILPALAVVVFSTLVAGWFLLLPLNLKELAQSVAAQTMLVSNVYFWQKSGYFAQAAEVKPLLHTWSLAVEEQFYLLFPFLLIAFKRFSRKFLILGMLLIGGISLSLCICLRYKYSSACFYLLPMRAWELMIGAILAALPAQRAPARWLTEVLSCGGLLAILCAVFFYDRETPFPGIAATVPCVGAALIIWGNGHTLTSVGKLLAARPLVFIGLISYSLYLWHWPVLVFFKYWTLGPIPQNQRILLLIASLGLAVLSWRFVETPFRKRLVFNGHVQIFSFAAVTTTVLFLMGITIHQAQGVPSRISPEAQRYAAGSTDMAFEDEVGLKDVTDGNLPELGVGDKQRPIKLLVWGDSHAMAVMPALDILCKAHAVRGVAATHSSTAPLVGYLSHFKYSLADSIAFNDAVVEFIRRERLSDVLIVAVWGGYGGETDQLHRGLLATINALKNSGARIWIMKQVPEQHWSVPQALASAVMFGRNPEGLGLPLVEYRRASRRQELVFDGVAGRGVTVLDPTQFFVNDANLCRVAKDGKALYRDTEHLTTYGAMLLRPLFEPIFEGIVAETDGAKISKPRRKLTVCAPR